MKERPNDICGDQVWKGRFARSDGGVEFYYYIVRYRHSVRLHNWRLLQESDPNKERIIAFLTKDASGNDTMFSHIAEDEFVAKIEGSARYILDEYLWVCDVVSFSEDHPDRPCFYYDHPCSLWSSLEYVGKLPELLLKFSGPSSYGADSGRSSILRGARGLILEGR
jgi:hypothetical protein